MYRKEMLKRAILIACAVLAIAICVAVITFFVHTVRLRNEPQTFMQLESYFKTCRQKASAE